MNDARIGDAVGIICPHGAIGVIVRGSSNVIDNKRPNSRLGDQTCCCFCGCPGHIISGSSNILVNAIPAARLGDHTVGICNLGIPDCCPHGRSGHIISGSSNIMENILN